MRMVPVSPSTHLFLRGIDEYDLLCRNGFCRQTIARVATPSQRSAPDTVPHGPTNAHPPHSTTPWPSQTTHLRPPDHETSAPPAAIMAANGARAVDPGRARRGPPGCHTSGQSMGWRAESRSRPRLARGAAHRSSVRW